MAGSSSAMAGSSSAMAGSSSAMAGPSSATAAAVTPSSFASPVASQSSGSQGVIDSDIDYSFALDVDEVSEETQRQVVAQGKGGICQYYEAASARGDEPVPQLSQTAEERLLKVLDALDAMPFGIHPTIRALYKNRAALIELIKLHGHIELFHAVLYDDAKTYRNTAASKPYSMKEKACDALYGRWSLLPDTRAEVAPGVPDVPEGNNVVYGGISNDAATRGRRHKSSARQLDPPTLHYAAEHQAIDTIDLIIWYIESRASLLQTVFNLYGYVAALDIGEDRLTRAVLHALEGLLLACNRGHRGSPAYNQVLNRFLGKPRAGTVGVNSTMAILAPGSEIRAVGASAPRVPGVFKSNMRDLDIERRAYVGFIRDGGVAVTVTSKWDSNKGIDVIYVYLPQWFLELAVPSFSPSAEVRRRLPPLPASSKAILRIDPRSVGADAAPALVQGPPIVVAFFALFVPVLTIGQGEERQDFELDWTQGQVMSNSAVHAFGMIARYACSAHTDSIKLPSAGAGSHISLGDILPPPPGVHPHDYTEAAAGLTAMLSRQALPPYGQRIGNQASWQVSMGRVVRGSRVGGRLQYIPPPPAHLRDANDLRVRLCFIPDLYELAIAYVRGNEEPTSWQTVVNEYARCTLVRIALSRTLVGLPSTADETWHLRRLVGSMGEPIDVTHKSAFLMGTQLEYPAAFRREVERVLKTNPHAGGRARVDIPAKKLIWTIEGGNEVEHRGSKHEDVIADCIDAIKGLDDFVPAGQPAAAPAVAAPSISTADGALSTVSSAAPKRKPIFFPPKEPTSSMSTSLLSEHELERLHEFASPSYSPKSSRADKAPPHPAPRRKAMVSPRREPESSSSTSLLGHHEQGSLNEMLASPSSSRKSSSRPLNQIFSPAKPAMMNVKKATTKEEPIIISSDGENEPRAPRSSKRAKGRQ